MIEVFLTGTGKDIFLKDLASDGRGIEHAPDLGRNQKIGQRIQLHVLVLLEVHTKLYKKHRRENIHFTT